MNYKTFCLFNQIPKEKLIRLTKRKMSKMNFSLLMSVFGAYRNAYYLSMNHPLYQYICHFTINRKLLSQSDNQKKNFEIKYKDFSYKVAEIIKRKAFFDKNKNFNEEYLQFTNIRTFQLQRKEIHSMNEIRKEIEKSTLVIQKNIRRFLVRKILIRYQYELLMEEYIKKIITIQKEIRRYLVQQHVKKVCIINKIIAFREVKLNKIINLMIKYHNNLYSKEQLLIDAIINYRRSKIEHIQNCFRRHHLSKLVSTIISYEKTHYVITYPFFAKEVKMKIFFKKTSKTYIFDFCRLRHIFILYLDYAELAQGKYLVQLIVDGCVTCDGRFPHCEKTDGNFYNIIEFKKNVVNNSLMNTGTEDVDNIEEDSDEEEDCGYDFYANLKRNLTGKVSQYSSVD